MYVMGAGWWLNFSVLSVYRILALM